MKEALELVFFGVLASSTLLATVLMAFNFPRIRQSQHELVGLLHALSHAQRLSSEVYDAKVNQLEERVRQLEKNAFETLKAEYWADPNPPRRDAHG